MSAATLGRDGDGSDRAASVAEARNSGPERREKAAAEVLQNDDDSDTAPPIKGKGKTATCSDVGNAERFVKKHGDAVRYVTTWGAWVSWDGSRWASDASCGVEALAKETARDICEWSTTKLADAIKLGNTDKTKRAEALVKWATKSQSSQRLAAMTQVARSTPSIAVAHTRLDSDPMLLNVANGTVDLRTGALRKHDARDLLTKIAPVVFDDRATCPTFDAFLLKVMGGNAELVDYLARIVGYALTGEVRDHVLVFFYGATGANGKSTFLGTMQVMLGDYAAPASRGLLFSGKGEHPTALAALCGKRFVTCSEIQDGQQFDEALVKDLTGGDQITARRMREDPWTYSPTHKLFIAGNHKPQVRGDDGGIWRRIKLVPWTVTIPEAERDTHLPEKLRAELPGIMAWAVRGCLAWQERGLDTPKAVRDATAAYRDESDTLGQFFRLSVVFERDASVARKEIREAYELFCSENGAAPFGAMRFAQRLREHGVSEKSIHLGPKCINGWKGVRLALEAERAAAQAWTGPKGGDS
jgi:putative DNA primase/helicase